MNHAPVEAAKNIRNVAEVSNVLAQTEKDIDDATRRVEKIKEYL